MQKQIEHINLADLLSIHNSHVEAFKRYSEEIKTKLSELYIKLSEVDDIKKSAENELSIKKADNDKNEVLAMEIASKLQDATNKHNEAKQKLNDAETKTIELLEREKILSDRNTAVVNAESEVQRKTKEIEQKIKWMEMEDRRLKLFKIKIDRIIEDKQITEELKSMD